MKLSKLLFIAWVLLISVSQYFLNWITWNRTGLDVIGVFGLIVAVIWLFWDDYKIGGRAAGPVV